MVRVVGVRELQQSELPVAAGVLSGGEREDPDDDVGQVRHGDEVGQLVAHDGRAADQAAERALVDDGVQLDGIGAGEPGLASLAQLRGALDLIRHHGQRVLGEDPAGRSRESATGPG